MSMVRTIPGQSVTRRLFDRLGRRAQVGPKPSFYQRLGVEDPLAVDPALAADAQKEMFSFLSARAYYDDLARAHLRGRMLSRIERIGPHGVGSRLKVVGPHALELRPSAAASLVEVQTPTLLEPTPVGPHGEGAGDERAAASPRVYRAPRQARRLRPMRRALEAAPPRVVAARVLGPDHSPGRGPGVAAPVRGPATAERHAASRRVVRGGRGIARVAAREIQLLEPDTPVTVARDRLSRDPSRTRGLRRVLRDSPSLLALEQAHEPARSAPAAVRRRPVQAPAPASRRPARSAPVPRQVADTRSQVAAGRAGPTAHPARVAAPPPRTRRPTEWVAALSAAPASANPLTTSAVRPAHASLHRTGGLLHGMAAAGAPSAASARPFGGAAVARGAAGQVRAEGAAPISGAATRWLSGAEPAPGAGAPWSIDPAPALEQASRDPARRSSRPSGVRPGDVPPRILPLGPDASDGSASPDAFAARASAPPAAPGASRRARSARAVVAPRSGRVPSAASSNDSRAEVARIGATANALARLAPRVAPAMRQVLAASPMWPEPSLVQRELGSAVELLRSAPRGGDGARAGLDRPVGLGRSPVRAPGTRRLDVAAPPMDLVSAPLTEVGAPSLRALPGTVRAATRDLAVAVRVAATRPAAAPSRVAPDPTGRWARRRPALEGRRAARTEAFEEPATLPTARAAARADAPSSSLLGASPVRRAAPEPGSLAPTRGSSAPHAPSSAISRSARELAAHTAGAVSAVARADQRGPIVSSAAAPQTAPGRGEGRAGGSEPRPAPEGVLLQPAVDGPLGPDATRQVERTPTARQERRLGARPAPPRGAVDPRAEVRADAIRPQRPFAVHGPGSARTPLGAAARAAVRGQAAEPPRWTPLSATPTRHLVAPLVAPLVAERAPHDGRPAARAAARAEATVRLDDRGVIVGQGPTDYLSAASARRSAAGAESPEQVLARADASGEGTHTARVAARAPWSSGGPRDTSGPRILVLPAAQAHDARLGSLLRGALRAEHASDARSLLPRPASPSAPLGRLEARVRVVPDPRATRETQRTEGASHRTTGRFERSTLDSVLRHVTSLVRAAERSVDGPAAIPAVRRAVGQPPSRRAAGVRGAPGVIDVARGRALALQPLVANELAVEAVEQGGSPQAGAASAVARSGIPQTSWAEARSTRSLAQPGVAHRAGTGRAEARRAAGARPSGGGDGSLLAPGVPVAAAGSVEPGRVVQPGRPVDSGRIGAASLGPAGGGASAIGAGPSVAQRLSARSAGLLSALARANRPEEVVRVIVERGGDASSLSRELATPAGKLIQRIVETADRPRTGAERPGAPSRNVRTIRRDVLHPVRTYTTPSGGGGASARGQQGVGASGVMKLANKLMNLIHLAEVERKVQEAQKHVRMAADTAEARREGGAGQGGAEGGADQNMNIEALQQEVLESVLRELELNQQRREDPDGRSIWW